MRVPEIKVFLTARAVILVCAFLLALGMVGSAWAAAQYDYIATTKTKRANRQGAVKAGSLTWKCQGNQCRIRGPWPIPSVSACRALAKQVGFIQRYGHAGRYLSKAELNKCNEGSMVESPIRQRAVSRDDFEPVASPPPTGADRVRALPIAKPPGGEGGTPQDVTRGKLQTIPFDLAIEEVSKPVESRHVKLRVGDKVSVRVSVRNRHGMAAPVIVATTSDRPVLAKSKAGQIPPGARIEVPIEMYINPRHVQDGTFKAYVWLGTSRDPLVYRDANRANNIHEVVWSVAPRPRSDRPRFPPPIVGGRSASGSDCDAASVDTPCQVQPTECTGRGADWQVTGTYQCVRGELRCVARAREDYCNNCGVNCGACTPMSCSTTNPCAPGSICIDNPALTARPTCRSLNDDYVASRTGRRVCTHIPNFCWTPDEVGQPEIICREAR